MGVLPAYNALIASAKIIPPKRIYAPKYQSWQQQLWDYYDRLGEFESGVSWRANAISRVRLLAAELMPGGEEPRPVETGPAAEAVERLAGGTGGQTQLMREITVHLSVPGEGWLVGETVDGEERWHVASADELRVHNRSNRFELREGEERYAWRPLASDSIVMRVWNPHPRYGWRADSDAFHAMDAMLELDLINKRIVAEILSRLASNGILLYDRQKLSFPSVEQPEGADQVDPFAAVLVDVASRGIKDPTSPEATIPIPIGFDLQDSSNVDPKALMQHVRFAEFLDEKLLEERNSAVKRLATSLDLPSEVLLGMSGMNHWGAWQVEETGIKIHIAPFAELITHSLTTGYLIPYLKSANAPLVGPNGGRLIVWYDPSEITVRPDRSANTLEAYRLGEVSGSVLRRELGLNETGDKPTQAELREWLTLRMASDPATAPSILELLGGPSITRNPAGAGTSTSNVDEDGDAPADEGERTGTPRTQNDPPPNASNVPLSTALDVMMQAPPDQLAVAVEHLQTHLNTLRPKASQWVEAGVPLDTRVTPVRRNSAKSPSETEASL